MIGRKWPGLMNQDSWCISLMAKRGYADYQQRRWHLDALLHFKTYYPNSTIQVSEHRCRPSASIHGNCVPCQWYPLGYQQDNAASPTARILKEWLEEHDSEFLVIPWPLNSSEKNPFEKQVLKESIFMWGDTFNVCLCGYPHLPKYRGYIWYGTG